MSISLIDVHTRRVVPYPGRQSEPCDFLALSYVWGKSMQPSVLKSGRLPRTIPLTISDSMTVVKRLGKRYLWVDSICINQSNPGGEENPDCYHGRYLRWGFRNYHRA
jgi:hypothetical protein